MRISVAFLSLALVGLGVHAAPVPARRTSELCSNVYSRRDVGAVVVFEDIFRRGKDNLPSSSQTQPAQPAKLKKPNNGEGNTDVVDGRKRSTSKGSRSWYRPLSTEGTSPSRARSHTPKPGPKSSGNVPKSSHRADSDTRAAGPDRAGAHSSSRDDPGHAPKSKEDPDVDRGRRVERDPPNRDSTLTLDEPIPPPYKMRPGEPYVPLLRPRNQKPSQLSPARVRPPFLDPTEEWDNIHHQQRASALSTVGSAETNETHPEKVVRFNTKSQPAAAPRSQSQPLVPPPIHKPSKPSLPQGYTVQAEHSPYGPPSFGYPPGSPRIRAYVLGDEEQAPSRGGPGPSTSPTKGDPTDNRRHAGVW